MARRASGSSSRKSGPVVEFALAWGTFQDLNSDDDLCPMPVPRYGDSPYLTKHEIAQRGGNTIDFFRPTDIPPDIDESEDISNVMRGSGAIFKYSFSA